MDWYGGRRKACRSSPGRRCGNPGQDPVAIRYVLARDPEGEQPDAAYFCTDEDSAPRRSWGTWSSAGAWR